MKTTIEVGEGDAEQAIARALEHVQVLGRSNSQNMDIIQQQFDTIKQQGRTNRQLEDVLDLMKDEFERIKAKGPDDEIMGLCDRAISHIKQRVPVITQRDEAQKANREMGRALERIAEHLGFVGTATELADTVEEQIEHLRLLPESQP